MSCSGRVTVQGKTGHLLRTGRLVADADVEGVAPAVRYGVCDDRVRGEQRWMWAGTGRLTLTAGRLVDGEWSGGEGRVGELGGPEGLLIDCVSVSFQIEIKSRRLKASGQEPSVRPDPGRAFLRL